MGVGGFAIAVSMWAVTAASILATKEGVSIFFASIGLNGFRRYST